MIFEVVHISWILYILVTDFFGLFRFLPPLHITFKSRTNSDYLDFYLNLFYLHVYI